MTEQEALNMRLSPEDFTHVDIFAKNRLDQISGKSNGYFVSVIKRFVKNKWAVFFFLILLTVLLLSIIVPLASPYSYNEPVSTNSFAVSLRPRWPGGLINGYYDTIMSPTYYEQMNAIEGFVIKYSVLVNGDYLVTINPYAIPELSNIYPIFGTDAAGIDIWTKTWKGASSSLLIAFAVATVSVVLGAIYGAISGACAGTRYNNVDIVMMRIVEILSGIPTILWLLILSSIIVIGGSTNAGNVNNETLLVSLIFIVWMGPAITTRTYILKTKDAEYIQAVRTLGGSQSRIIFVHMLPNISGRLLVRFVNIIPTIVFYESTLVFLGIKSKFDLGLGTLIDEGYQVSEYIAPLLAPSLVLILLTLSSQIVANGINDAIDPRVTARK